MSVKIVRMVGEEKNVVVTGNFLLKMIGHSFWKWYSLNIDIY